MTNSPEFKDWKQIIKDRQSALDLTPAQLNAEFAGLMGKKPKNTSTVIKRLLNSDADCYVATFLYLVECLGGTVTVTWGDGTEHKIKINDSV